MPLLKHVAASPATPLVSLTAVFFDTETTALDIKQARVIEIGAVALVKGALKLDLQYETLLDPDVPIPPASTKVHGITEEMVAGHAMFPKAYAGFRRFVGKHILLGYALDFDMAVIAQEHKRAGLSWTPLRHLCIRRLVRLLAPPLPDFALETIAGWLGVPVTGRHRALADAILTANIFQALLPLLRQRGIRTLGEAMAAAERVSDGPDNLGATEAAAITALPRVDSYPYRHTIADVMTAPPVTLPGNTRIAEALHLMVERRISSVFVSRAADWGILTERDILRCFDRLGSTAYNERIESFASFPLVSVKPSDRLYVAIGRMTERRIKHLAVIDDRQELVGALTQRDLLRLRAEKALALTQALSDAATVQELADVWHGLADATRALLAEDVDPRDVAAIISGEVCALTARAARMALKAAPQPAPQGLRFAVLVLGSGGRGESMLALDQDNAIIFDGGEVERQYLLTVAARMNAILDEIGVPLCKGKVMASNPQWCHTSQEWRHIVSGWMSRTAPEDVMNADIFFDFCAVHGDLGLADDLRQDAITAASQSESFLKLLSLAAAQINLPLGWFGKFRTDERGRMDLKRGGIMPVFTAARVAALRHGVFERSSLARLSALRGKPDVPQRAIEALAEAHGLLMGAILHQQLDDIAAGTPPSNLVDPKALSALQRDKLKWALEQVPLVRDLLGDPV